MSEAVKPGLRPAYLRGELLRWYDRQQRDLPWRRSPSLYRTVVSEFMLQQTQVATVLPYFERWTQAFPDFDALARAPEAVVLKAWEGLGYYARARNLHRLAKHLASTPIKPHSYEEWLQMPGVGPYTAAAIASIAFGHKHAVVDGNVVRVIARLYRDSSSYNDPAAAVKACRPKATALLAPHRPGDFNQAIMDLGATVCRPRHPTCLLCPWRDSCAANRHRDPENYPVIRKKNPLRREISRIFLFDRKRSATGAVLLEKIPDSAIRLAGQFQIPEWPPGITPTGAALLVRSRGIANEQICESTFSAPDGWRPSLDSSCLHWMPVAKLQEVTMPGPHRRWLQILLKKSGCTQQYSK